MDNNSRLWQIQHHLMVHMSLDHFPLDGVSCGRMLYNFFFF